jgi:hypothetical protein
MSRTIDVLLIAAAGSSRGQGKPSLQKDNNSEEARELTPA